MAASPNSIDVRSQSSDVPEIGRGGRSPRVEYYDGEIPPALSPLDAFAAQGRLLAKQLDESMRRDRRLSRLPPASVARSLSQPRPGYFRSQSSGQGHRITRGPKLAASPAVEEPIVRPQSEHPRLSGVSIREGGHDCDDAGQPSKEPAKDHIQESCFRAAHTESPEESLSLRSDYPGAHPLQADGIGIATGFYRTSSTDSAPSYVSTPLAASVFPPPQSLAGSRIIHPESSDDDNTSSNTDSTFSKPRKLSSGSAVSMPYSPMSPFTRSHRRSPSQSSEASNEPYYLPRPSFNFSRPLSRSSTSLSAPSPIIPAEPISPKHHIGIQRNHKPTPISLSIKTGPVSQLDEETPISAVSTYIYAKYSLPRGRMVSRNSLVFSGLQTPHFEWKEPIFDSSPPLAPSRMRTPSPLPILHDAALSTPDKWQETTHVHSSPPASVRQADSLSVSSIQPPPRPIRIENSSAESIASDLAPSQSEYPDDAKSSSADSTSTIQPQRTRIAAPMSSHMMAEEHVAKGIECHENGSLQESTYHLRIAAKMNHPTGMLLYALACRHGWGMRRNQREGVQWLRKAMDSAQLEVVDEGQAGFKGGAERKARQAQFALSIYELGVSHLNGWGIEQDKVLALRCFEIAGKWGDPDALAEAGYCYAEGIGCKKDLKKAAKFYRMAESRGMSMVGNSWIYKDKYMCDDEEPIRRSRSRHASTLGEKPRSKSRTRSIFGRKKSTT